VTHVLNLGIVGSQADYLHRAGRVGRIGQRSRGQVISVLAAEELPQLLDLGSALQFTPQQRTLPEAAPLSVEMDKEEQVQALEDIYNLLDTNEPESQ